MGDTAIRLEQSAWSGSENGHLSNVGGDVGAAVGAVGCEVGAAVGCAVHTPHCAGHSSLIKVYLPPRNVSNEGV